MLTLLRNKASMLQIPKEMFNIHTGSYRIAQNIQSHGYTSLAKRDVSLAYPKRAALNSSSFLSSNHVST